MKRLAVIKTGTTFANTAERYGDFEDWTQRGLGLSSDEVWIIDALAHDLPPPEEARGVVITGSHAMVTDASDWKETLSQWIRQVVHGQVPFLGICYGHQLLAQATGGRAGYHPDSREISTVRTELLPESQEDDLFAGLPAEFCVHTTHSQTVLALPPGATLLARNSVEPHHAFRLGRCAWGVQFHPEYDREIMRSYISEQAEELAAEGRNLDALYESIQDTAYAAELLRRFAEMASLPYPLALHLNPLATCLTGKE